MISLQVFPLPGEVANMIALYEGLLAVIADKLTEAGVPAQVNREDMTIKVGNDSGHLVRDILMAIPEVFEIEPRQGDTIKLHVIAYRLRPHGRNPEQANLLAWVANNLTNVVSAELVGDDKLMIEFSSGDSVTMTIYSAARN